MKKFAKRKTRQKKGRLDGHHHLQQILLVLKELCHFGVDLGFGQSRSVIDRADFILEDALLLLVRVQNLQKLLVDVRLTVEAVLDLVDIVDGVVELNRLGSAGQAERGDSSGALRRAV